MIPELKGVGELMTLAIARRSVFELLRYADSSHGIRKNGILLGVWEPDEEKDCYHHFGTLLGLKNLPRDAAVLVVKTSRDQAVATISNPLMN